MRAHHGFVVRSGHYNSHFVGQNRVDGIVAVETGPPHGRPHIIPFQAQDQFKNFFVKFMVKPAVIFHSPAAQRGFFVVQENTAVFHLWFARQIRSGFDIQRSLPLNRNIGPPVPGRNANFARQAEQSVNGSAFVASGNNQRFFYSRKRIFDHFGQR